MFEELHFHPRGGNLQGVALGVAQHEPGAGGEELRQVGVIQQLLGQGGGTATDIFLAVGRIGED